MHSPSIHGHQKIQRVTLDVDGYPVAPDDLQLEQVQIFVRHGERSPVGVRMNEPPASIPAHWLLCKTARRFQAAVTSFTRDGEPTEEMLPTRRAMERTDGTRTNGECLLGELTDIGRQSTYNFGRNLRDIYIDKLGFLPDTLHKEQDVYFRSTNMPRTIESMQQIIHGLYPTSKWESDVIPPIVVRNGRDENIIANTFSCKRLEILGIGFAQAAAAAYNHTLEPLDKKLSKYIGGNPIRLDGKPRASGILDTIKAATAHGVKVPPEFEEKAVIDTIEKAVVNEWFAGFKTEEVRRLGMGRLFSDVVKKMQLKASSSPSSSCNKDCTEAPKILLHSTHDTAIAGICSTLDIFDDKWPAFTSSVTFELFSKKEIQPPKSYFQTLFSFSKPASTQYYVRTRYQNRSMPLPFCSETGKHLGGSPEFCTLQAFEERVKELTPVDFEKECDPMGSMQ